MDNFNIIIAGVGGQGLITLVSILDEAAFLDGYEIKSSELHGLSQRGGSVEVHVKIGKKVDSPLVGKGAVNLVLGLELSEALRETALAGKDTKFLVDKKVLPYLGGLAETQVLSALQEAVKDNLHLLEASKLCKEKLDKEVLAGIYLLGYASSKKLMPISEKSILQAIRNVVPEKYQEMNIKAFELSKNG